ncbi:MAG: 23S rRNA (guanosine(2251)-2'-O)-methyltransferase RlmB [Bacteroidales bacterium]|nr:23S rRNA (guanosine(2251)-2'-O)-methyltransferase RlmB [Bacteroidales bacterium]
MYYNRKQPGSGNEMIFGIRAVMEAVAAGKDVDKIWIRKNLESNLARELFEQLKGTNIPVQRVPQEKLNHITTKNHQGVIAFVSPVTYQRLEQLVPLWYEAGKQPLVVALDSVTDVRNFGAIARTCACAGVDAIVLPMNNSVTVNADAVKTSAGALHTLPVCRENSLRDALRYLKDSGFHLVAATEKASQMYTAADYSGPTVIVMGAEDTGIAPEHLRICDELVQIPILGNIASLNVSVAAGIMIYEAVRQRQ